MPFEAHTTSGLRGDYTHMRPDWTVDQPVVTENDHAMWRTLYQRQMTLVDECAEPTVQAALHDLNLHHGVPDFDRLNALLQKTTGFSLVAVPGLIPGNVFFTHLANRRFPATCWLRLPSEMDYLVEPDVFHDVFGHVPLLLNKTFADYMARFGVLGLEAAAWDAAHPNVTPSATERLSRLYWFTVEFGLIQTLGGVKAYGAGILSSYQETSYAVQHPSPRRLPFSVERAVQQQYRIDQLQTTYFVLDSYAALFEAIQNDMTNLWHKNLPEDPWYSLD